MPLTIREAAESAGLSRQALMKAIKTGKVSATKSEIGQWRIEPAELHRVYPKVATQPQPIDLLVATLQAQVEDLRQERDRLLAIVERQTETTKLLTDRRSWWQRLRGK
jgi:predicted site-specific integrase-resolvase